MSARQHVPGLVHLRGEAGGSALVGMEFLHKRAVDARDVVLRGALRKPKDFIGFVLGHLAGTSSPAPGVRVLIVCATPSGKPAVEIEFQ